jgi:O-antigen/teichoic acid export membrane protein
VLQSIAYFLSGVVLAKSLGFLQSFIVAKTLAPANFGVWVTLMLVASYGPIVCLGTVETLLKQVPYYRGRNEPDRVKEIEDGILGSIVLASLFALAASLTTPFVMASTSLSAHSSLIVMVFVTMALGYFSAYFYHRFAAYEDFKSTGLIDFLRAAVALLFVGGMGWKWGLQGAVLGYLLHEAVTCLVLVLLNVRRHGKVGVSFRRDLLVHAVRVGFPITIVWWVLILQNSVDRVVLGSLLGPLSVGHYGLGLSVMSILSIVPMVVGRVLYPKVNRQFGEGADQNAMRRLVFAPTLALATLLANLQVLLLAATPILYNELLPKYRPGLLSGQILILGCFFVCLLRNGANYLIAANKQRLFLKYILISLIFNILTDVALVKTGWGIEGVALGTSVAGVLLNTLVWRRVSLELGFERAAVWLKIGGLYFPSIVLVTSVIAFRLVYHGFLEKVDSLSFMLYAALFFVLNGALSCVQLYRTEMRSWRQAFLQRKLDWKSSSARRSGLISRLGQ